VTTAAELLPTEFLPMPTDELPGNPDTPEAEQRRREFRAVMRQSSMKGCPRAARSSRVFWRGMARAELAAMIVGRVRHVGSDDQDRDPWAATPDDGGRVERIGVWGAESMPANGPPAAGLMPAANVRPPPM
jgi:hypothetical protein